MSGNHVLRTVYVLNTRGQTLLPTSSAKARKLLKAGQAKVKWREPFTIQLTRSTGGTRQEVILGVDAGYRHIGLSASTQKRELFASEVELRSDITKLIAQRREQRRSRRNRKTRYRAPRFDNRVYSKHKGWFAPSTEHRINSHLRQVDKVLAILPVSSIVVETASFDIQKIMNPDIEGVGYQQGPLLGFYNVREYVLRRDNYTCQCCHGKSGKKVLEVHHIESRLTGGDAINNLITLCRTCHRSGHLGKIELKFSRGRSFKAETFMSTARWEIFRCLKTAHPELKVRYTYGYITRYNRDRKHLEKSHCADAFCIAGNLEARRADTVYFQKQVRRHNRQIHKLTILKGGKRKLNQLPYEIRGFRLFDKVLYKGRVCFIFGRRASSYFDIRTLDGTRISAGISCKKLKLIARRRNFLTEARPRFFKEDGRLELNLLEGGNSSPALEAGVSLPQI